MASKRTRLSADAFTVGLIYVKPLEMQAISVMLDECYEPVPLHIQDDNEYTLGKIGSHNVVVVGSPRGAQGKVAIADAVSRIRLTFVNIRVGLLVGIGGGVPHLPKHDVRLGDVVVGAPEVGPVVVQYDRGKQLSDGIVEITGTLRKPPAVLLRVVDKVDDKYSRIGEGEEDFFTTHLQRFANFRRLKDRYKCPSVPDRLFRADYNHELGTQCSSHDQCYVVKRPDRHPPGEIRIHYSTILSGDLVMKSAEKRDEISAKHGNALCFEMEAAGLMDAFPCLVIRGICDYADSHKSKEWQKYAAATAAAYAREILLSMAERLAPGIGDSQKDCLNRAEGSKLENSVRRHEGLVGVDSRLSQSQTSLFIAKHGQQTNMKIVLNAGQDDERIEDLSPELLMLLHVLQFLKTSCPDPDNDFKPGSIPRTVTMLLSKQYARFSYISSVCLAKFFNELV
ncbi:uncharacterized protein TRUGW13939_11271 [Talaromyces rugulosus]|uniref:Uncharacterized protein n=1 Tax=Talaromyces rugulosus TaxID=121627 RepID=A0A7H8RDN9_TALRU|nr:uncharacterized protein TRUGW13939_11271 [Talaromyces rugulosus]QKX64098.1 hypothetical protein TRUGW13939_11271 [Talaromyces rugulosus]